MIITLQNIMPSISPQHGRSGSLKDGTTYEVVETLTKIRCTWRKGHTTIAVFDFSITYDWTQIDGKNMEIEI